MKLTGKVLVGKSAILGDDDKIFATNPATGETLEPGYPGASLEHVEKACALAFEASDEFRNSSLEVRAAFIEQIAENILDLGDELVKRATEETGLPVARIEGERMRTCNQLKLFASVVRKGNFLDVRLDSALKDNTPPRPDLRMKRIALGPVAVFGASNFPLAFSVAGGDTASAFAAGCPVVVKAHSAHPGTSELVGQAIQKAVEKHQLPEGVFSLLFGSGNKIGTALVKNEHIKAVGFTGSRNGGFALMKAAFNRPDPIPVYAEMSSINPVFIFPDALKNRSEEMAKGFIGSLTMGAGQFCTNPGLIIAKKSSELDQFISKAEEVLKESAAQTMLTPGIHKAYTDGIKNLKGESCVKNIGSGKASDGPNQGEASLFKTTASDFLSNSKISEEVFGSASVIIECENDDEVKQIAEHLEGQLTATLLIDESDYKHAGSLVKILERKAGRILCNGFPTGVEVSHTMVHGGPHPATSDSRTTSVGSAAIERFLRPVCYQDFPAELLSDELSDNNPLELRRLVNGE